MSDLCTDRGRDHHNGLRRVHVQRISPVLGGSYRRPRETIEGQIVLCRFGLHWIELDWIGFDCVSSQTLQLFADCEPEKEKNTSSFIIQVSCPDIHPRHTPHKPTHAGIDTRTTCQRWAQAASGLDLNADLYIYVPGVVYQPPRGDK